VARLPRAFPGSHLQQQLNHILTLFKMKSVIQSSVSLVFPRDCPGGFNKTMFEKEFIYLKLIFKIFNIFSIQLVYHYKQVGILINTTRKL
jgi:hypothetical protein